MTIIGENVMSKNAIPDSPEERGRFKYPHIYESSTKERIFFIILCAVLLFLPYIVSSDKHFRICITGFVVLVDIAYILYAFGSKIILHADKIEYQSCFIFKRFIPRSQILSWQLQVAYVRNAEIFSLVLKSRGKNLAFEINFEMDPAFYAWFPNLQTLVQERWMQFPGLRLISK